MKAVEIGGLIAAWSGCVACGLLALLGYELTPSAERDLAPRWPDETHLVRDAERPTLLAFFHPHCPCSRASMAELAIVADRCKERARLQIAFTVPEGDSAWQQTSLTHAANQIPGATVHFDKDGVEADRFGARASGEVVLYGHRGELLFRGGITASRGHEGDNAGRAELIRAIEAGAPSAWCGPVYGCPLLISARN